MGEGKGCHAAAYLQAGDGCVLPHEANGDRSGCHDQVSFMTTSLTLLLTRIFSGETGSGKSEARRLSIKAISQLSAVGMGKRSAKMATQVANGEVSQAQRIQTHAEYSVVHSRNIRERAYPSNRERFEIRKIH